MCRTVGERPLSRGCSQFVASLRSSGSQNPDGRIPEPCWDLCLSRRPRRGEFAPAGLQLPAPQHVVLAFGAHKSPRKAGNHLAEGAAPSPTLLAPCRSLRPGAEVVAHGWMQPYCCPCLCPTLEVDVCWGRKRSGRSQRCLLAVGFVHAGVLL